MGDNLQMKKNLSLLLLFGTLLVANSEVSWVDEQIEAIKPPRKSPVIASISDPFIFLDKNKNMQKGDLKAVAGTQSHLLAKPKDVNVTVPEVYNLSVIINKKALINDKWYSKDDNISKYKVLEITNTSVTLQGIKDKKKELKLTTTTHNSIKFKNK